MLIGENQQLKKLHPYIPGYLQLHLYRNPSYAFFYAKIKNKKYIKNIKNLLK